MDTKQHGAASSNKPLVFSKMESLVREMQDPETGIPIRPQKIFLTSIPSAFMGYDLIEWLMERLDMEDSAEAIHLANLLCQYGYFFPVGETRSLMVKDDSSLYRFQTPYYWASQNHSADTTDYAIYLTKRLSRNKQKHGLEDYEVEAFNKLKKGLQHKWDFVTMQAEEQVKLAKDRKKGDKIVTDSQERAYWRVYRPPPGFNNCLENAPVPDRANVANRVRKKTWEERKKELVFYNEQIGRTRMKASLALEGLISHFETYAEFDFFLVPPQPSNPFISDDVTFWILNESIVEVPTEKRARKWAISFQELVSDQTGIGEFTNYLRKEYCHENIRFWQTVNELRYGSTAQIAEKVKKIFDEFLKPGAPCEINIDGKTMEATQLQMKTPTRHTYEAAAEHVYVLLLKKDCYPRFLRSEHYKNILTNAVQPLQKKRFFSFGGPGKKKISAPVGANSGGLQTLTPQPLKRHGSDEHTASTPVSAFGMSHIASESSLSNPLQPRIDCDPPYSATAKEIQAESAQQTDDVCPWDASPIITVPTSKNELPPVAKPSVETKKIIYEKDTPGKEKSLEEKAPEVQKIRDQSVKCSQQKLSLRKSEQSGRFHHTLPHNMPVKSGSTYNKPPRPDRSKSVDVNPVSSRVSPGQLAEIRPTLSLTTPADLCISHVTAPPQEKFKREQTSLAPTSSYLLCERRASEGSRFFLDSKRIAVVPCWKETVHLEESSASLEDSTEQQGENTITTHTQTTDSISPDGLSLKSPGSDLRHRTIDYSVRSAHLPSQHGLAHSASSPKVLAADVSSSVEIRTSTAPFTMGIVTMTTTQPAISLEQKNFKLESVQSIGSNPMQVSEAKKQSPKNTKKDGAWGESTSQKSTDVCPWEDEESCKIDAPYVKTYATLGYL